MLHWNPSPPSNGRRQRCRSIGAVGVAFVALIGAAGARAAGGDYVIAGGTAPERSQVRAALNTSAFDWSLVPEQITITVARDVSTESTPGEITVDSGLLDSGRFAWGFIQHEYAHQVDFFLLDPQVRAMFLDRLGGTTWIPSAGQTVPFRQIGAERFASLLSWAYWPSADNADDTFRWGTRNPAGMVTTPSLFRELLTQTLDQ